MEKSVEQLPRLCGVAECGKELRAKGLCVVHYNRVQRHGSTEKWLPGRKVEVKISPLDSRLRYKYGVTLGEYSIKLEDQNGKCAICKRYPEEGKRLEVDHNHITNQIRGLLCNPCNLGIGRLEDDPTLLRSAIAYLERYG